MASKYTEQRTAAVKAVHATIAPAPDYIVVMNAQQIAALIRGLSSHAQGWRKVARWDTAVERYAKFVEVETAEDASRLTWAYTQGSVFFGYEVEGL